MTGSPPSAQTFSNTMFQDGNNTGIEVPAEVVDALGAGKRPPVVVSVNGYRYRSTIAPMGGKFLIPFSAQRRAESGIGGGDAVEVTLTLDTAPRIVEVPADLAATLAESDLTAAWDKLSPSRRKAHVTSVEGAKTAETRARRVAAVVTALGG
ncbi:YdeI/OmpD-associated family protein [Mycolicibacterium arseniciresistens]|uniref:YdeI/OmpD-associated family protein n=1 Tax=Mycolicibacterium arseniciresistens TaxID=3062257 RepID=A0ABT8UD91_9MYCO|nr:YdeI/OmpD-associated family protein [Mycolicibacterium arseniciresistens]MDO3634333.1 YdeI/OmpD-associated family protein [Mycolicibacterium arseniciresistens]